MVSQSEGCENTFACYKITAKSDLKLGMGLNEDAVYIENFS